MDYHKKLTCFELPYAPAPTYPCAVHPQELATAGHAQHHNPRKNQFYFVRSVSIGILISRI
jgi:hypothetical protein